MCRVLLRATPVRRVAIFAHPLRQQKHLKLDIEGTFALVGLVQEVVERPRVAFRPRWLGSAEGFERLGRDDPGRDCRGEVLREEGTERLVLPGLNVARGPVVQQAVAGHMLHRLLNRDRAALLVAGAYPDTELELVVQVAAGAEARGRLVGALALTARAAHRDAGRDDRGGPAVIAYRYPFVIRQERIVRPEQLADIGRVVDADIEVGVVTDRGRQVQRAFGGVVEQGLHPTLLGGTCREQLRQAQAKGLARPRT